MVGKNGDSVELELLTVSAYPKAQRDFEQLVVDALKNGNGRMTFATDLRLNLFFHPDKGFRLIANPMPQSGVEAGPRAASGLTWSEAAHIVFHLTEEVIRAAHLDDKQPFASGKFGDVQEIDGPLSGRTCYLADWEQPEWPL